MVLAGWIRENVQSYFGNATSRRDYRAQLRGTRAIWLWGGYLGVLVLLAAITYNSIIDQGRQPITQIQFQLQAFYQSTMYTLAILVTLIAPALTATSIVAERMAKSIDLVFTSPMSLKHYLVGKMISSFRYIWMLLILALPVTALSIVMGGATWTDVLGAYIILSAAAVVVTAIGLLISALSQSPVAAILWTYIAVGGYVGFVTFLAISLAPGTVVPFARSGSTGLEWMHSLSPFLAPAAAPETVTLFGKEMPAWVIAVFVALLLSRLLLLGAGAALGNYGSAETKGLRISAPIYLFLVGLLLGYAFTSPGSYGAAATAMPVTGAAVALYMLVFIPHIVCSSRNSDRKYRPEGGVFSFRDMVKGGPAGALPFLWLLAIALFGGLYFGFSLRTGLDVDPLIWTGMLWVAGFWAFWWSLARALSLGRGELKSNRMILLLFMLVIMGGPVPILNSDMYGGMSSDSTLSSLYILAPLVPEKMEQQGMVHAVVLLVVAAIIAAVAEGFRAMNRRKVIE